MTYFLLYHNKEYGGIATLIARVALYLKEKGEKVHYIGREESYLSAFMRNNDIGFYPCDAISKGIPYFFLSDKDLEYLDLFLKQNNQESITSSNVFVSFDFNSLLYSLKIANKQLSSIATGFFHPEAWPMEQHSTLLKDKIFRVRNKGIKQKEKGSLWRYQRKLLQDLDNKNGSWFMSESVKAYHEFYYEVDLPNSQVIPLPFDVSSHISNWQGNWEDKKFRVIWLGRFEYFKNPSIKKVFCALQNLAKKYGDVEFEFSLIGYGDKYHEQDIRSVVQPSSIKVNYLGKVSVSDIDEILIKHDLGVAMGTSALHMGVLGLPTINIEGGDQYNQDRICGTWLFDQPIGLASGVYLELAGLDYPKRMTISSLLEEAFEKRHLGQLYGEKCRKYVFENHDESIVMPNMIKAWEKSCFHPSMFPIYRAPFYLRIARNLVRNILKYNP